MESLNESFRDECLNMNRFDSMQEAKEKIEALQLAGLVLEARPRRPPNINEVMARRAADQARADQLTGEATARSRR